MQIMGISARSDSVWTVVICKPFFRQLVAGLEKGPEKECWGQVLIEM